LVALTAVQAELAKRNKIVEDCFPVGQRPMVQAALGGARRVAAMVPRRSGKTCGVLRAMARDALDHPRARYAYIALTKNSAEDIVWMELEEMNDTYGLQLHMTNTKLRAEFMNGATISIFGADNVTWLKKFKGQKFRMVAIDEAGEFDIDLRDFIYRVIGPTLTDHLGTLFMVGTPGYIMGNYWWDITRPEPELREKGWEVFVWDKDDNPYIRDQWSIEYADMREQYGADLESMVWFQREHRGKWVVDTEDNVYIYNHERNSTQMTVQELPEDTRLILGVDAGYTDAAGFVLGAYGPNLPELVYLECYKRSEMLFDDIAEYIAGYLDEYPGLRIIADPNSLRFMEEMRRRWRLPMEDAQKGTAREMKIDHIRVMNNDFSNGTIKLNMPACKEYAKELIELKKKRKPNGKWEEHPRCANDLCDAALYIHREALHYLYTEKRKPPMEGTEEYFKAKSNKLRAEAQARLRGKNKAWWE